MINKNNPKVIMAKRILVHYFKMTVEAAGLRWENDCKAEIEEAVELIIEASIQSSSNFLVQALNEGDGTYRP